MTSSNLLQRLGTGVLVTALALTFGVACGDDDDTESGSGDSGVATTAAAGAATTVPQLTAPTAPTTTGGSPNTITIQNFAYTGLDAARANATWNITNSDSVPHTVTADDNSFTWRVEGGQTAAFSRTLAPGSYPIHCDIHPARMRGVLVVR